MTSRRLDTSLRSALAAGLILFAFGCAPKAPEQTAAAPAPVATTQADSGPTVERAREVAAISVEIERAPGRTSAILEAHGMSADQFEDALVDIAADAELTEAYEAARTK